MPVVQRLTARNKGTFGVINAGLARHPPGRRAGKEFGLSEDEFQQISGALGSGKTLELFQRIGSKLGEARPFDPSGSGGNSGFGMTPEAARGRIEALTKDKDWSSKYLGGGASEREEMERLQKIAAGAR